MHITLGKALALGAMACTFTSMAWADSVTTCSASYENHDYRVQFEYLPPGGRSSLWVDEHVIPRVREYCVEDQGGLRCPHREDGVDYEVYPRFAGSEIEKIFIIRTSDVDSKLIEMTDCD